MGVKSIKQMNLIQQLQQSPKWKEFEEWYNNYIEEVDEYEIGQLVYLAEITSENINDVGYCNTYGVNFCFLPPEFQKGVFEKFIAQNYQVHYDGSYNLYNGNYVLVNGKLPHWNSFEELLIWYFNN